MNNPPGPAQPPSGDFIVLATIVRPHGLKGEVKVSLACSGPERLKACKDLWLIRDGVGIKKVTVIRAFLHPDGDAVIRMREVVGPEEAESLRGASVAVLEGDREPLPPDVYYLDDLVGLKVSTPQGAPLGEVVEVMEGTANGVLVIRNGEGREILVPALKSLVREVDLKERRMVVEPPEEIDADKAD